MHLNQCTNFYLGEIFAGFPVYPPPPQKPPRRGFNKNVSPQKLTKIKTNGFH